MVGIKSCRVMLAVGFMPAYALHIQSVAVRPCAEAIHIEEQPKPKVSVDSTMEELQARYDALSPIHANEPKEKFTSEGHGKRSKMLPPSMSQPKIKGGKGFKRKVQKSQDTMKATKSVPKSKPGKANKPTRKFLRKASSQVQEQEVSHAPAQKVSTPVWNDTVAFFDTFMQVQPKVEEVQVEQPPPPAYKDLFPTQVARTVDVRAKCPTGTSILGISASQYGCNGQSWVGLDSVKPGSWADQNTSLSQYTDFSFKKVNGKDITSLEEFVHVVNSLMAGQDVVFTLEEVAKDIRELPCRELPCHGENCRVLEKRVRLKQKPVQVEAPTKESYLGKFAKLFSSCSTSSSSSVASAETLEIGSRVRLGGAFWYRGLTGTIQRKSGTGYIVKFDDCEQILSLPQDIRDTLREDGFVNTTPFPASIIKPL